MKRILMLILLVTLAFFCFLLPAYAEKLEDGDMNGDGMVNSDDAIHLLRHTLLPNDYPLAGAGGCKHENIEVDEAAGTCLTRGYQKEICVDCRLVVAEYVYFKAECTPANEATCTTPSHCSLCGAIVEEALGHGEVEIDEKEATCLSKGYHKETCKTCGELTLEIIYPVSGCLPDFVATCTEDSHCKFCGKFLEEAKGHIASETVIRELECSIIYACGRDNCDGTVEKSKENAEHVLETFSVSDQTYVTTDGKVCAFCSTCGLYIPVSEDVRLALDFDKGSIAAEFEVLNNDKISFYTKEDATKGPAAQVKEVDGRTVMYFAQPKPLFIDYDLSLLSDAEVFVISFDYCVAKTPYAAGSQIPLFTFVPGLENGAAIPGKSTPWAHTIDYDRTSLYFTDGKSTDPTQYFQPEIGKWYTVTIVVDNTYTTKANGTTGKGYVFVDGEFIRTTIEFVGCTEAVVTRYGGLSWRIGSEGNTHNPLYDNFKVSVIR